METRSADEIHRSTEKLLRDLRAVVQDGEELLRHGVAGLGEKGHAAKEKLEAALEMAKETRHKLEERAIEGVKTTDRLVREYPYQSLGIAFGIGLIIGMFASRR
jgi:ElaB/YqjD/DUF883 family membrane-anchored ribosome-binding protein